MQTIQYRLRRTRICTPHAESPSIFLFPTYLGRSKETLRAGYKIWEMKEDKYAKTLAKNQVCEICQFRDIGKNGLPKFIRGFVWKRTNMAAGYQQNHLFSSFPTNA